MPLAQINGCEQRGPGGRPAVDESPAGSGVPARGDLAPRDLVALCSEIGPDAADGSLEPSGPLMTAGQGSPAYGGHGPGFLPPAQAPAVPPAQFPSGADAPDWARRPDPDHGGVGEHSRRPPTSPWPTP